MQLQFGVSRHDGEVGLGVQHLSSGSDRDGGEEAIDQLPDGFAAQPAGAIAAHM